MTLAHSAEDLHRRPALSMTIAACCYAAAMGIAGALTSGFPPCGRFRSAITLPAGRSKRKNGSALAAGSCPGSLRATWRFSVFFRELMRTTYPHLKT